MALVSSKGVVQCDELYLQEHHYVKGDIIPLSVYTQYKHRLNTIQMSGGGSISQSIDGIRIRAVNTHGGKSQTMIVGITGFSFNSIILWSTLAIGGYYLVRNWGFPRFRC